MQPKWQEYQTTGKEQRTQVAFNTSSTRTLASRGAEKDGEDLQAYQQHLPQLIMIKKNDSEQASCNGSTEFKVYQNSMKLENLKRSSGRQVESPGTLPYQSRKTSIRSNSVQGGAEDSSLIYNEVEAIGKQSSTSLAEFVQKQAQSIYYQNHF